MHDKPQFFLAGIATKSRSNAATIQAVPIFLLEHLNYTESLLNKS